MMTKSLKVISSHFAANKMAHNSSSFRRRQVPVHLDEQHHGCVFSKAPLVK